MGEVLGWTLILGVVAAEMVFWSWLAALGRFFRVGRSCSVLEFNGFPQVVQCAGQAFCAEIYGISLQRIVSSYTLNL
jgi:hypothetical protein